MTANSMRRTQSVRAYARPAAAVPVDDLGVLHEADESTETVLRQQLLDKERENDKLQSTILTLQTQLAQRPPIETIQQLDRENKNLDLILQGTQRENERCMAELERVKTREKMLEQALIKLAGENWQSVLDITLPTSTYTSRTIVGSSVLTRAPPAPATESAEPPPQASQASLEATHSQIEQIRLLVLGMDQKMQEREEKLNKSIERAETQELKCVALRKEVLPTR